MTLLRRPATLILLATLVAAGCASTQTQQPLATGVVRNPDSVINRTCPVSGEPLPEPCQVSTFRDVRIGFGNAAAIQTWDSLSQEQQAWLLANDYLAAKKVINRRCPITGRLLTADATLVIYGNQRIGLADTTCLPQWNALTDQRRDDLLAGLNEDAALKHPVDHGR